MDRAKSFYLCRSYIFALAFLFTCLLSMQTSSAQGTWTPVAPMSTPRFVFAAASGPDGNIYAFGGARSGAPEGRWMDVVEAYDPVTNSWSAKAPMPVGTDTFAAATGVDGLIYTFGGDIASYTVTGNAYVYDPIADNWSAIPTMPEPRYTHAGVAGDDGKIYAIGGSSDGYVPLNTVVSYDPATGVWANEPQMSVPRYYPSAARGADGRIYVFGGFDVNSNILNDLEIYDPISHTWSTGAPMPTARSHTAAVEIGGHIYVVGGEVAGFVDSNIVEAYDPVTNTWTTVAPMSYARGALAMAVSGAQLFALGGVDGGVGLDTVEVYSPATLTGTTLTVSNVSGLVGQKKNLTARLRRSDTNAAIAGETVTFKVDGNVVGSDVTNATGHASFSYTLPESLGDHVLTAEFAGDANYAATSANGTLTVNFADTVISVTDKTAQAGDTINLIANLNRVGDGGVAGRTLVFTVNGQQVGTAVTNAGGKAVLAYTLPLAVGSKTIGVSFVGDSFYGASSGSGTLTLTQAATKLAVTNRTVKVGRTVALRARLHRVSDGAFLTGQTVQFSVNGTVVGTGTTDSGGYANLLYTPSSVGTFPILAEFFGDVLHTGTTDTGTLTVNP